MLCLLSQSPCGSLLACKCFMCATPEAFSQQALQTLLLPSHHDIAQNPSPQNSLPYCLCQHHSYVVPQIQVGEARSWFRVVWLVLQSLEGEFYCLARTKLSKHNVVFSDIWLLLVLLVRKVSYSCVFFISGLQNFATCSDLFFLCWYRMLVLLQGVMHIKMMQVCSCLFKVCSELATT